MEAVHEALKSFPGLLDLCTHGNERQDCPKCRKPDPALAGCQTSAAEKLQAIEAELDKLQRKAETA